MTTEQITPQPTPDPQSPPPPGTPSPQARQWALIAHLSGFLACVLPGIGQLIGPLIVWQLKKDEDPFIDDQGKEALNFQITVSLLMLLSFVLMLVVIGFFLMGLVAIGAIVLMIIAAIKSNEGIAYRYPFCWRVIK
ncbi:MAG: DUF4870 domain-containing protein [Halopseudomonas sp.]|uniref:DUF4870 domain-containing protein n=1 Tax=Halopseudomonas sp. TaxID=2901191 RepID=UPI0030034E84